MASGLQYRTAEPTVPESIGGRYQVREVLGRGGMAVVYRVLDTATGREVALKQIAVRDTSFARDLAALFEREFHTLAQLSHPRVIEVYDYGLDPDGAYYTMELLDGLDLRERSPLPAREACALLYDVCSSLALLHSRRLVHRDVSPRNIRCTRDGLAKLIDFGALMPVGSGGRVVGTPAFTAPEVVHGLATDARTDLYSLGATLYYALTGRPPYPVRDFADLTRAWAIKPPPPSSLQQGVPAALDKLVLSLLSLEPASRPRSAFEVMQRLAVLAGIEQHEPTSVARAYLSTPVLVGREAERSTARDLIAAALAGQGGSVLIGGAAGVGRSRMLDACVLEAKLLGALVLRADAHHAGDGAVARALGEQLTEALRPQRDAAAGDPEPPSAALFANAARRQPLVIAVDDVHAIDASSAALLAGLAHDAPRLPICLLLTAVSPAPAGAPAALAVVATHCTAIELRPLAPAQTLELVQSVFGDVPNIAIVSARVHEMARGNPRECMDLAQHLVDHGLIAYVGGGWSLPDALTLAAAVLPSSGEQAFCERVARLQPLARTLVECHAVATHDAFTREQYAVLAGCDARTVDRALDELVERAVVVGDGRSYTLSHGRAAAASLTARLAPDELAARHRALAGLYEQSEDAGSAVVYHLFQAGESERALDRLLALMRAADARGGVIALPVIGRQELPPCFERAFATAQQLARPAREQYELGRWLVTISIVVDDAFYWRYAPEWLEQLVRDSGLAHLRELPADLAPGERLRRALEHAVARHAATPEAARPYPVDEAIKLLVHYVAISIAIGARTGDARLIRSLPSLLEPFASLSPLVEAMWQNAICTVEVNCDALPERARVRAAELYTRLQPYTDAELPYVSYIRHALAYCAGAIEAGLGLRSAIRWAEILDRDVLQQVNAMNIRKVLRLQRGDAEGAERFRRQAEVLAVQAITRQMFNSSPAGDLVACALAHDLTGVKQAAQAIETLAAEHPGWTASRHLAEGHFQRLRGKLEAALAAYERCLALCAPDPHDPLRSIRVWPSATAGAMQALIDLGKPEQARALGEPMLAAGKARGLGVALHEVARTLALAEARLGDDASAVARLDQVIAEQRALGVSGLHLGVTYEARARVAIWAGDGAAVEEFGRLTAREFRHGRGSPLGALYDRLMDDARQAGVLVLPELSEFESTMMSATKLSQRPTVTVDVAAVLRTARDRSERATCALDLLCDARGARSGCLYLIGEDGLALAASDAEGATAEQLLQFAREHLERELEPEEVTVMVGGMGDDLASRTTYCTDPSGTTYRAFLITSRLDGDELCAGVVLLVIDPARQPQSGAADTIAAVGRHLIQAGDARGVPLDR